MTPVGDIEIEVVSRIAVKGRTGDLAKLLEAVNKAEAVLICIVEKPIREPAIRSTAGFIKFAVENHHAIA